MKLKYIITIIAIFQVLVTFSQNMELAFTAIDSATHVQIDSIKVMNRTQGVDTVLYYPDTVLSFLMTGFNKPKTNELFKLHQNYPNPVAKNSTILIQIPTSGLVSFSISDYMGNSVLQSDIFLQSGLHSFRFSPGNSNLYIFNASYMNKTQTIKILALASKSNSNITLEHIASQVEMNEYKVSNISQNFFFNNGDYLLYIAYYDTLHSGIIDSPQESQIYIFQFAINIPCPEYPTITYDGQIYNTIQIFSQCWFKENLNVGVMILGNNQTNNGIIEKNCYRNETDSCTKYGGLYQWDELMQYSFEQGVKGICPEGWHVPTDEEWKILEGAVDGFYPIGHSIWGSFTRDYRGTDCAINLKSKNGWYESGNGTDIFNFTSLPAGKRYDGVFESATYGSYYWTSTHRYNMWSYHRVFTYHSSGIYRSWLKYERNDAMSVRCLKD